MSEALDPSAGYGRGSIRDSRAIASDWAERLGQDPFYLATRPAFDRAAFGAGLRAAGRYEHVTRNGRRFVVLEVNEYERLRRKAGEWEPLLPAPLPRIEVGLDKMHFTT